MKIQPFVILTAILMTSISAAKEHELWRGSIDLPPTTIVEFRHGYDATTRFEKTRYVLRITIDLNSDQLVDGAKDCLEIGAASSLVALYYTGQGSAAWAAFKSTFVGCAATKSKELENAAIQSLEARGATVRGDDPPPPVGDSLDSWGKNKLESNVNPIESRNKRYALVMHQNKDLVLHDHHDLSQGPPGAAVWTSQTKTNEHAVVQCFLNVAPGFMTIYAADGPAAGIWGTQGGLEYGGIPSTFTLTDLGTLELWANIGYPLQKSFNVVFWRGGIGYPQKTGEDYLTAIDAPGRNGLKEYKAFYANMEAIRASLNKSEGDAMALALGNLTLAKNSLEQILGGPHTQIDLYRDTRHTARDSIAARLSLRAGTIA